MTHHTDGKEPISAKKLVAGDGNFDTKKEMIGFVFDRVKRTVPLPPTKAAALVTLWVIGEHSRVSRSGVNFTNILRVPFFLHKCVFL